MALIGRSTSLSVATPAAPLGSGRAGGKEGCRVSPRDLRRISEQRPDPAQIATEMKRNFKTA
jgi:hypothetical protein